MYTNGNLGKDVLIINQFYVIYVSNIANFCIICVQYQVCKCTNVMTNLVPVADE